MSLSSLINSLILHNELVIQWLIVLIIGLVSYLAARSLFKKPTANKSSVATALGAVDTSQVEEMLNQILEKTSQWDRGAAPVVGGSEVGGGVSAEELEQAKKELAKVKSALSAKESELKDALARAGATGDSGAASKELMEKLAELEAKLAEYEILEDDIADLSMYKEENARLKSEMERLKGGEDFSDVAGMPIPEPDNSEDLVKEFAEAVGKDSRTSEEGPVAKEEEPVVKVEEAAEQAIEEISPLIAEEEGAFKADPLPEMDPPSENPLSTQSAVDDLFAELSSSDLDTDKVAEELAAIEKMDVTASAEEALGEELDADKMAQEAGEFKP